MATYSDALIDINEVVTRFCLLYKKPTEDIVTYVEHACMAYMDFNLYDGNLATYQKYTLSATNKWLDMPDDMLGFIDLVTPYRGSMWSFTRKDRIVMTTTTTGGVEGQDSNQGEGQNIDQPRVTGYGAKGGWNKFRYNVDWATRRIYIDDDITEYIVLYYVSSGIKATGATEIPAFIMPMIHSYLLSKETYWVPGLERERAMREASFWREKMKVRELINSMSVEEWKDIFYSSMTQSPQR
jgi:hypothetical protein